MKLLNPRAIALTLLATFVAPSLAAAQMVVSDPVVEQATQSSFLKQIQTFIQEGKILDSNQTQVLKLQTQIQNQITAINNAKTTLAYQKQQISGVMQQSGIPMLTKLAQNNTLMSVQSKLDPALTAEFKKLVPSYAPGQNYAAYAQTLYTNTAASEAQALGVGSDAVTSEADVAKALGKLGNSPVNELQSLQEMIQIGKIQSGQLDKLVKIQSAMMKNMSYEWAAQMKLNQGGGSTLVTNADPMSARTICETHVVGFDSLSKSAQTPYWNACLSEAKTESLIKTAGQ